VSALTASPVLPPTPLSSASRSPYSPDISPQGLAGALTVLESERYSKIMPSDCIAWLVGAREDNPISTFIADNDKLSYWVTESILKPDEQSKRFENRKYFLWVAEVGYLFLPY
jgi:son of sevenless